MGYTHYFRGNISKRTFAKMTKDIKKIENSFMLFDAHGEKRGVDFGDTAIRFNGNASKGEMHETFCLELGANQDFCKTNRKPYDAAVVIALLCMKSHLKSFYVKSDGDFEDVEWQYGLGLFHQLFPDRDIEFEFIDGVLNVQ